MSVLHCLFPAQTALPLWAESLVLSQVMLAWLCWKGWMIPQGRKCRLACAVYKFLQGMITSLFSGCSSIPSTVKSNFSLEENKKPCGISCKRLFSMIWRNMKDLRISDYFSKLEIVLVLRRIAFSLLSVAQEQTEKACSYNRSWKLGLETFPVLWKVGCYETISWSHRIIE